MNKTEIKPKNNETIEEENERLKKFIFKGRTGILKKLKVVVKVRKNQQQKKK